MDKKDLFMDRIEGVDKREIGGLFDAIAPEYDFLNHLLTLNIDRLWRRKAVMATGERASLWLDLACGSGDMALEAVKRKRAERVVGVDLSENMLLSGRKKVEKRGLQQRISLQRGDCCDLAFGDATFEVVSCGFGVRNFYDTDKGFAEMFRVLKPGGRLAILEFAYPENAFIRFFYDFYFNRILPFAGRLISRNKTAYRYLPESVKGFFWGEEFAERLRKAGFEQVAYRKLCFGICDLYTGVKR